jgi:hypothetical protein
MGRRAHKPDPAQRRQVEARAAYGIPAENISRVFGIDAETLRKHYRDELDLGETKANAQIAGFLFNAAKNGNVNGADEGRTERAAAAGRQYCPDAAPGSTPSCRSCRPDVDR